MTESDREHWLAVLPLAAATYAVVGVVFAIFAGWATSPQVRGAWRLAAWLVSGAVLALHIGYEKLRLRHSSVTTASHAAAAAALGACTLAAAALLRALWTASGKPRLLALALVLWPAITFVPAFLVSLVAAALLARIRPSR